MQQNQSHHVHLYKAQVFWKAGSSAPLVPDPHPTSEPTAFPAHDNLSHYSQAPCHLTIN